jgi:RNA polymerase sigma-70 factor (ECF subfamily)
MRMDDSQPVAPLTNQRFTTTHWSVVLTAREADCPGAAAALERLCRTYWGALYGYLRRSGRAPADAADLTQAFFARFIAKEFLEDVDRQKGKFRSFLLKSLNHFLADEWRHAHAEKRAATLAAIPIHMEEWESRYGRELTMDATPETLYERRWALRLFEEALGRLREEFVQAGRGEQFGLLKEFLSDVSEDGAYANAAERLGLSPGAVAVQVHRLRRRYGELVREEVAHTVAGPGEVEEELRYLLGVLSR